MSRDNRFVVQEKPFGPEHSEPQPGPEDPIERHERDQDDSIDFSEFDDVDEKALEHEENEGE